MAEKEGLDEMTKVAIGEVAQEIITQMKQDEDLKAQNELTKSVSKSLAEQAQILETIQKQQKKFAFLGTVLLTLILCISLIGLFI